MADDSAQTPVDVLSEDWGAGEKAASPTETVASATQVSASDDAAADPAADAGDAKPTDTGAAEPDGSSEETAKAAEPEAAPEPNPDQEAVMAELANFVIDEPAAGDTTGQTKQPDASTGKPEEASRSANAQVSGSEFEDLVKLAREPIPGTPEDARWVRVHPQEDLDLAGVVRDLNDESTPFGFPGNDGELFWVDETIARLITKGQRADRAEALAAAAPAPTDADYQQFWARANGVTDHLQSYGLKRMEERLPFIKGNPELTGLMTKLATGAASVALAEGGIGQMHFGHGDKGSIQQAPGRVDVGIDYLRRAFELYDQVVNAKQQEARKRQPVKSGAAAAPATKPIDQMTPDEEDAMFDSSMKSIRAQHRN